MSEIRSTEGPVQPTMMADRLQQVEHHTRQALAQRLRPAGPAAPVPTEVPAPARLVPVPRRARMFSVRGAGFADVVLTSPPRTPTSLFAAERPPRPLFG